MEEAEGPELSVNVLTSRIMVINIAAIHVGPDVISSHASDTEIFQILRLDDFPCMLQILDADLTRLIDAT